ncbi:hypothetical protein [Ideonella sp.]|uniref:hypothetical protein n=1 Tax=Ideonella sp. TaxID=1929293 RepID=UPI003BB5BE13
MTPNELKDEPDDQGLDALIKACRPPEVADQGFTQRVMRQLPAQHIAPDMLRQQRRARGSLWGGLLGTAFGLLALYAGSAQGDSPLANLLLGWPDRPGLAAALCLALALPGAWLAWQLAQDD